MSLFNNNPEVYQLQKILTRIYISYYIFELMRSLLSGILRSVGHEKIVSIYLVVIHIIYTLIALMIGVNIWGIYGAIYTMTSANLLGSIIGILIFMFMNLEERIKKIINKLSEDKRELSKILNE